MSEYSEIREFIKRRFFIENFNESIEACFLAIQFRSLDKFYAKDDTHDSTYRLLYFISYSYAFIKDILYRSLPREPIPDNLDKIHWDFSESEIYNFLDLIKELYLHFGEAIDVYNFELIKHYSRREVARDIYPFITPRDSKYTYRCIRRVNEFLAFQDSEILFTNSIPLKKRLDKFIDDLTHSNVLNSFIQNFIQRKCVAITSIKTNHQKFYYALSGYDADEQTNKSKTKQVNKTLEEALKLMSFAHKYTRCIVTDSMKSWFNPQASQKRIPPLNHSSAKTVLQKDALKREFSCCERKIFAQVESDNPNYKSINCSLEMSVLKPPCQNCSYAIENQKTENFKLFFYPPKKLLLLGGSHAEIPLIEAAKKLGWYVITTGNNRDGLGHPHADKTVFADFSDKEAMLELARAEGVQAVCSGCNDFALLSTVYVCEKLGLPGHDSYVTSLEIHHKDKYRALATRLGIPTPRAITVKVADTDFVADQGEIASKGCADFETAIAQLTFPIIVKPVDLTGGKGIHRAANAEEAREAYRDACSRTRQDHVVVEEFVEGTNHGFSAMLVKGKVAFAFADNEQYYLNKYLVSGANTPSTSDAATLAKLRDYSERIAQELHLVDGILHIQYIEKADGTPVIIEICRRPPGDLYIKFVKYATGIDYPKFIVMAETGMDISGIADVPTQGFWLRHCIMADCQAGERTATGDACEGIVRDVTFAPEIQENIVEKFLWYKPGEVITDKLTYKAGIVFFKFATLAEMQDKTARMTDLAKIVVD